MPDMTYAFRFSQTGGPEVLSWTEIELPAPGPDEIGLEHEAVGVNYIDIYHRTGAYPLPLPSGVGVEGAGRVTAVGGNVSHLSPGDRVAYVGGPPGAYAQVRLLPAGRAVKIPDWLDAKIAAATIFKGLTACYLVTQAYPVKAGETVLLHAAAGGVGRIAAAWLKHLGAHVIGVVGSEEKAAQARAAGVEHVVVSREGDFAPAVRALVPGGVDVVYDSVGRVTFAGSLDSLRPRGMLVSFGTASGPIPANDLGILGAKGSLYFTRCSIAHYMATNEQLRAGADQLFALLAAAVVPTDLVTTYPLREAARAQADLEGRRTAGSLVLLP
jgi:NADPH2:quinone reductase